MSSVAEAFQTLKGYIRSTHVHDNARDRDSHLWPGEGSIDWNEAVQLLQSAPHVPPILLEIEGTGKEHAAILNGMGPAYQKMEQAAGQALAKTRSRCPQARFPGTETYGR